ncbi:MAG: prepilin-type N-terminal cleavage/methylation domain-containing protein [Desulfobacterales bacterium]|nr:prepilin-type N-terminal cleavage/methylation domain-containing protein [Desulfobacterales bacterium]
MFPYTINPTNSTKAYTLIELMVVVLLIGLMLALAIPRFHDALLTDDLKAATRRMIGTVRCLRNKAVREQKVYRLHFDLESNRFWIEWHPMTNEERAEAREKASGFPGGIRILNVCRTGAGKKEVGDTAIHFNKKGYVEQAVIHLGAEDGRAHTIVLSPFLGTIKTYDRYVEIDQ